ncbi:MAG: M20/M25/M40 family metallo-hydrolase, partial [Chloroflexi bacterium]|nr:M20/M25/M40 family metallo-hydrolase [Chloroflexota bacterium]
MPASPAATVANESAGVTAALRDLALAYVGLPTASLREAHVYAFLRAFAQERGLKYREDTLGNAVIEYRRGRRTRPLVLGAHTDHPGFVVTTVNGRRLELEFRGGVPGEYGRAEHVRLYAGDPSEDRHGARAAITSTVTGKVPGRSLRRLTGAKAMLEPSSEAKVGDLALWDVEPARVRGSILHARSCDDLGGGLAILWALDRLARDQPNAHVLGLFTRAEEVGLLGAAALTTTNLLPGGALVVAVECSSMAGGRAVHGDGPIIRVGDAQHIFSPRITMWMTQVARELQTGDPAFKFQRKLMDGGTTEATAYDLLGYEAGAACLALGNYHNMGPKERIAAETIHLGDVEGLARLFVAMAENTRRV